jgi:excisionase family DNA binding protein
MNEPLIEKLFARIEKLETLIHDHLLTQKAALSFDEAVQYMNVSPSQLYKLTCKRIIPAFKPGGKLLFFKRADLDNWMLSKRRKTDKEIKSEALTKLER